jgi:DNA-binding MarR family transcriptional regulator
MVCVELTEQGHEQIEVWQQQRRAFLLQLLAPLDEQDQAELQRLLERMLEHIEPPVSLFSTQRIDKHE